MCATAPLHLKFQKQHIYIFLVSTFIDNFVMNENSSRKYSNNNGASTFKISDKISCILYRVITIALEINQVHIPQV